MYETDQKALYRVYAAFALVLIALGAYVCFCISADGTSTNGLQSDTDREIGATQEQQRQIADEISGVRNANSDAQNAVERAEAAVDRSKKAALRTSNEKLQSAENSLNEMQQSLTKLKEQISFERKAEQRIQKRLRHQRTFAWCVAGVTAMYAVKNH